MMTPTVHLNGTSKAHLVSAIKDASHALLEALELLRATAPNGRDYYPQGPHAYSVAEKEHCARLDSVTSVRTELMDMWEQIEEATKGAR